MAQPLGRLDHRRPGPTSPVHPSTGRAERLAGRYRRSMRVLVVTRLRPARPGLATLLPPGSEVEVVPAGEVARCQPLDHDAVLLDGPLRELSAADVDALRAAIERGASLLAVGAAPEAGDDPVGLAGLLGATSATSGVTGPIEVFATVAGPGSMLTARSTGEFPVVDAVAPLVPVSDDLVPVLTSNIGFRPHLVVGMRAVGRGRVVVSSLGTTDRALTFPELSRILRRALLPPEQGSPRPLGLAVVGYGPHGGMGDAHGAAATAVEGLELVAAVDPEPSRRKAAEQAFPHVRTYGAVAEVLLDGDVDVGVIATPPSSHATLALQLLRAGKHVVLEKPMCLTLAEADELIATAEAQGLMLTVHQNRRWDPDFVALRRVVDAGMLGDVFNVETFVGGFEHPCRAWHSEHTVSGGAVYDWGSHHVDWILQLMGTAPARVTTTAHKRVWHDVTNLDQLRLRLAWDDGREAQFLQSDIAAVRPPKLFVQGTEGTLVGHYRPVVAERVEAGRGYVRDESHHAEAPVPLTLARHEPGYGITETLLPPAPEQRFAFHRNLADHLHLDEPLAVTPRSVRAVVAVLEASHGSGTTGETVELEGAGEPVGP